MNKRQRKKWASWWKKDLYKFIRRYPKEGREIIQKLQKLKEQEHE